MKTEKNKTLRRIISVFAAAGIIAALFIWYSRPTLVDTSVNGEYTAELLAVSDPGWPFGPQEGRLALKKNGWTVCEKDFTLFNDGGAMKKSNWSVTWDDEKAAVVISGQEQPDAEYYLYYVGAALRSITNGE